LQLSVIIVSYNVKYFLEQCLLSVIKASEGLQTEIIVIDNNSSDGSRAYLEKDFKNVKFFWLTENLGFGKANNQALTSASGEYILFLNPDTLLAEDSLQVCLAEMKANNTTGALGVRMIDGSGQFLKESKRGLPTPGAAFFKFSGLSRIFPRSKKMAAYYAGHLDEFQSHDVAILSGAFMMLSKKAVEATKGFDEDFFMYGEDVDLSYRITKAGMRCRYFAGTTIIHFKGESTQKSSPAYRQHFYGAMKLFVQKHFPEKKWLNLSTGVLTGLAKTSAGLRTTNKEERPAIALRTAAVASQNVFDQCIQLLKYATQPLSIVGRIATAPDATNKALDTTDNMASAIKTNKIDQLVFCSASLPLKNIIALAQKTGRKTQLLFWLEGSRSMVGSNDKNKKGKFIVDPQHANPAASA
jgi:N-acetylglucosaminyl-diphospho-decaprenol L-rhamnosyltransferase